MGQRRCRRQPSGGVSHVVPAGGLPPGRPKTLPVWHPWIRLGIPVQRTPTSGRVPHPGARANADFASLPARRPRAGVRFWAARARAIGARGGQNTHMPPGLWRSRRLDARSAAGHGVSVTQPWWRAVLIPCGQQTLIGLRLLSSSGEPGLDGFGELPSLSLGLTLSPRRPPGNCPVHRSGAAGSVVP